MLSGQQRQARSRVAAASWAVQKRPHDANAQAHLDDARRDYKAITLEEHVRQVVDTAPPLTDEQCERITTLLRSGR